MWRPAQSLKGIFSGTYSRQRAGEVLAWRPEPPRSPVPACRSRPAPLVGMGFRTCTLQGQGPPFAHPWSTRQHMAAQDTLLLSQTVTASSLASSSMRCGRASPPSSGINALPSAFLDEFLPLPPVGNNTSSLPEEVQI